MIIKYGTPGPAEIVEAKNIPAWLKPADKEKAKEAKAEESEEQASDEDSE
jgi:hypothetical protein